MGAPVVSLRLIVSRRDVEHSSEIVPAPLSDVLRATLADLYERLGCEASGREVTVEVAHTDGRKARFYAEGPEASPEEVAEELWERIVRWSVS